MPAGLLVRASRCTCLVGEAILQASVAELVDRSDGAQDIAFASVLKKPHKAYRGVPAPGKLSKRERSRPGLGVSEPAHEPEHKPDHEPGHEPGPESGPEPIPSPTTSPTTSPADEPGHEPGQEPEGLVTLPGSAGAERTRVTRSWLGEPDHEPGHEHAPEPAREPGHEPGDEPGHEPGHEARPRARPEPDPSAGRLNSCRHCRGPIRWGGSLTRPAMSPTRSANTSPTPSAAPRRGPESGRQPGPEPDPSPTASPTTSPVAMTRGAADAHAGMRHHARSRVQSWFMRAAM